MKKFFLFKNLEKEKKRKKFVLIRKKLFKKGVKNHSLTHDVTRKRFFRMKFVFSLKIKEVFRVDRQSYRRSAGLVLGGLCERALRNIFLLIDDLEAKAADIALQALIM